MIVAVRCCVRRKKHAEPGLMGGISSTGRSLDGTDCVLVETLCRRLVAIFTQQEIFFSRPQIWSRPEAIIQLPNKAPHHHTNEIVSYIHPQHSLRILIFQINPQNPTVDALTAGKNDPSAAALRINRCRNSTPFSGSFQDGNPAGKQS